MLCFFKKWLSHFHSAVPKTRKRPLILVYGGYNSHFNADIVQEASTSFWFYCLQTLPILCNHWILPCSSNFKNSEKSFGSKNDRKCNWIAFKEDVIEVSSIGLTEGIQAKKKHILSGFEFSIIWPLNFVSIQARLNLFQDGGVDSTKVKAAPRITGREVVHTQILLLPQAIDGVPMKRKVIGVQNLLLNREHLNKILI
jgi:hypothetical protein